MYKITKIKQAKTSIVIEWLDPDDETITCKKVFECLPLPTLPEAMQKIALKYANLANIIKSSDIAFVAFSINYGIIPKDKKVEPPIPEASCTISFTSNCGLECELKTAEQPVNINKEPLAQTLLQETMRLMNGENAQTKLDL